MRQRHRQKALKEFYHICRPQVGVATPNQTLQQKEIEPLDTVCLKGLEEKMAALPLVSSYI